MRALGRHGRALWGPEGQQELWRRSGEAGGGALSVKEEVDFTRERVRLGSRDNRWPQQRCREVVRIWLNGDKVVESYLSTGGKGERQGTCPFRPAGLGQEGPVGYMVACFWKINLQMCAMGAENCSSVHRS